MGSIARSKILRSPTTRWAVPVAAVTLVAGAAVAVPLIADAEAELPDRSAGELLAGLVEADDIPFAGTVVHSADLGLPDLPGSTSGTSSPMSLLSGATTARIWYTDPSTFRVAVYGELSESDLIRDGDEFWYWNSDENVVMHETAPEGLPDPAEKGDHNPASLLPAEAMAELALRMVEPSTDVEVDGTTTVADRAAYELVARPRDERSLIESVRVAIDGEHGVPLRVRIYGDGSDDPAVEVGFTSVSFAEPDRSAYEFTPPPGARVEEFDFEQWLTEGPPSMKPDAQAPHGDGVTPELKGSGWTSVLVLNGVDLDDMTSELEGLTDGAGEHLGDVSALADAFLGETQPMNGPYGSGVGFESELLSALWVDDGRLLLGAVSLDVLEEAAAS